MRSTQDLIEHELLRLCKKGHFEAFMLFNDEGIPMAGVGFPTHYQEDGLAALSVILSQSAAMTEEFSADANVDEISLRTGNKFRIVSRPFQIDDLKLILVAIVPQHLPYRKITTAAVQKVQQLL
jgi:predicted regulator of Ras-like GTPase activity (Roadblock/LC7/MglB family)